ncbi:hypothetical protein [Absidia glauca]|uniref:Uncharacterized protein n=1 Tax=Absidia glauca TaxID=4829 RepID=A0A163JW77_ABSGL|nr:hypothetical protein [Absidia glauca]
MSGNQPKKSLDKRDSSKQAFQQHPSIRKNAQGRQESPCLDGIAIHYGLNGFNGAELKAFLNQQYSDTLAALHSLDASKRPVKHEAQEKAWGKGLGSSSIWGQKGGIMANGQDFLVELVNRSK